MSEFFIEIFCEEIPARMQVRAGSDLAKAITDGLKKSGLTVDNVQSFTGPRRLVFTANIPAQSPDVNEERKGPRVGAPEPALAGFMKAAGLTDISQAQVKSDKKGEFYVAITSSKGRPSSDIISEIIPSILNDFPWPKSMKSGANHFRWVRPLQRMICLLDGQIIPVQAGGITASNITEGHRRHGKGPFEINGFENYIETLENQGHVLVSAQKRKEIILSDARKLCADKGLELVEDDGLLNEVSGLTEWPVVLLGDMDPEFLKLPDEVIRLTLKTHQKTFTVRDPKTGKLAAHYIIVANQIAPDGGAAIKKGNGKVISARLSDARFFQTEDAKIPLIEYYDKLGSVVFHKKLGSIQDKAERVAALARELAPKVGADADKAEQAARLAKCDLVTQTVVEFTSLQGQIGAQMYRNEGGDEDIATAIEEHYKPQGPSDAVPTNPVAVAVALADKLDTLVGFWAINEKPTGSKDPYALRRAALGVVRIVLENDVRFIEEMGRGSFLFWLDRAMLGPMLKRGQNSYQSKAYEFEEQLLTLALRLSLPISQPEKDAIKLQIEKLSVDIDGDIAEAFIKLTQLMWDQSKDLLAFILDRLKVYLRDQGMRHDIIDAAMSGDEDDLVSIVNRVKAVQAFLSTDEGENLLAGYKRAVNILKSEVKKGNLLDSFLMPPDPIISEPLYGNAPDTKPSRPTDPYGAALFDALQIASTEIKTALAREDYSAAMQGLAQLRAPIDAFFTQVQVISDDTAVKDNNLKLLLNIRDIARQIADFEAIQG